MKLVVTVTSKRMKYVPCRALRMDTNYRSTLVDISENQCQCGFDVGLVRVGVVTFEGQQSKRGPTGWEKDFSDLF